MSSCCDTPPTGANSRRNLLLLSGKWLSLAAIGSLFYPLLRFLGYSLPKNPVRVRVEKDILPGGFHIDNSFVLFVGDAGAWAVSRRCTHLGCQVAYNETQKQLICPCHQSKFSKEGRRLDGPARHDLARYEVEKAPADQKGYTVII